MTADAVMSVIPSAVRTRTRYGRPSRPMVRVLSTPCRVTATTRVPVRIRPASSGVAASGARYRCTRSRPVGNASGSGRVHPVRSSSRPAAASTV